MCRGRIPPNGSIHSRTTCKQIIFPYILDTKTLIDPSDEANINKHSAENLTGKIEFKNVSFAYPTKPDQKVLKNVSFTIEPG